MPGIRTSFFQRPRALTLSVALNLFLAGAVGGLWLGADAVPDPAAETEYSFAAFVQDLPDETRNRIASALDQRRDDVSRRIDALARARAEVVTSLGSEPHDPDRVRRALVALRETTRDVQAAMHAIVGDITQGLSSSERAHLARSMFATLRGTEESQAMLYEVPLL